MSGKVWSVVLACLSGLAFVPGMGGPEPAALEGSPAAAMVVDAVHSSVVFRVKHLDVSYFYGRFNKVAGEFMFDEQNPGASTATIEIDADSIDTNDAKRDGHLKSQDFFSVKEFPKVTFKSKTVKNAGSDWEVAGELTLRGETRPLTIIVKPTGTVDDPRAGKKAGFETEFTIKRSDFGMTYGVDKKALSDEVKVIVGIEAGARK
jgi:polyisoprenoid-binding protein YceI